MSERTYLDNAATSWPKRPEVAEAMVRALELGSNYGRGQSRAADDVRRVVDRCRSRVATLFAAGSADQVVFTSGGTESLNLAIYGSLEPGDRVITTAMEHNSVLRPLHDLYKRIGLTLEIIPADSQGVVDKAAFETACERPANLVVLNHASNVTGAVQEVESLACLARRAGAIVVLDACQTAGHVEVDIARLGVHMLATSGHKGLGGPLGTGVLVFADDLEQLPRPLRVGGTGGQSEQVELPAEPPARYESGSLNTPGIFGLEAALASFTVGVGDLGWIDELSELPGVTLHGPGSDGPRVGVASITVAGWDPHDLANVLESEFGIETRAGLHCAPMAHEAIGTLNTGGTVRISPPASDSGEWEWIGMIREVVG